MRHLLLVGHLLGFVLWMGGGLAAMNVGLAMRGASRDHLALLAALQARLHRALILPGTLLVVVTGLLLTLRLYNSPVGIGGFPPALMVMQGAGLLGAGIVLAVSLPTVARLSRLDPSGDQAPLFAALLKRARIAGSLTGTLALTALVAGALLH